MPAKAVSVRVTDHACPRCRAVFAAQRGRCPLDGARLRPAIDDPLVGTWFAGRYLIEELVGHGAMGRVYRARHLRTRDGVAVLVLSGDRAADPRARAQFIRDAARAGVDLAGASLPYLAIHDLGRADELLRCESARELDRRSALPRPRRRRRVLRIALAAALLGSAGAAVAVFSEPASEEKPVTSRPRHQAGSPVKALPASLRVP